MKKNKRQTQVTVNRDGDSRKSAEWNSCETDPSSWLSLLSLLLHSLAMCHGCISVAMWSSVTYSQCREFITGSSVWSDVTTNWRMERKWEDWLLSLSLCLCRIVCLFLSLCLSLSVCLSASHSVCLFLLSLCLYLSFSVWLCQIISLSFCVSFIHPSNFFFFVPYSFCCLVSVLVSVAHDCNCYSWSQQNTLFIRSYLIAINFCRHTLLIRFDMRLSQVFAKWLGTQNSICFDQLLVKMK